MATFDVSDSSAGRVVDAALDPSATHLGAWDYVFDLYPIKTVLEFGCGMYSTPEFVKRGCDVTAIEMQNAAWAERVRNAEPKADIQIAIGPFAWRGLKLADWYDMIFVDGHGDSRPECLEWAKERTNIIVAHDTEHPYYQWSRANMNGFTETVFNHVSPTTTLWYRPHNESGWREVDGVGAFRCSP